MREVIQCWSGADIAQACSLFERVFGHSTTEDAWRWKYDHGPRMPSINVVVRGPTGQLLGHAGASIFPGMAGGKEIAMAQICDIMVDPAARSGLEPGGVYATLVKTLQSYLQQQYPRVYAYGFAGIRPYKLGHRMGFYRAVHQCRTAYIDASMATTPTWHERLWLVSPISFDSARLDRIWARRAPHLTRPTVARTGAYLEWRYARHPANHYRIWAVRRWCTDQGWLVTRDMPNAEVCIVDALLPANANASVVSMALIRKYRELGSQTPKMYAWFMETPQSRLLEPVMGCEVKVGSWHDDIPAPRFHPGDTDVY